MEENSVYIIKEGDTLESIARDLRVNVDDLIESITMLILQTLSQMINGGYS